MRIEENSSNHTCHSYTVVLVVQGAHIPASPYMSSSTRKFEHLLSSFFSSFQSGVMVDFAKSEVNENLDAIHHEPCTDSGQ